MIIKKRKTCVRSLSDFQATVSVSDDDESSGRLKMDMGACYFPKDFDSNPESLGQDAHFICQERQAFGVADGVGGWARKGVDSGIFARELMSNYLASLRSLNPGRAVDLKETLLRAHSKTAATGSSTACVVSLEGDRLCYANVGDSGFMVFRGKRLVYRSPTQQNISVFLGEFDAEQGDVVVAGSDGVFDNLFGSEIEEILQESDGEPWPQDLAWSIANCCLHEFSQPRI